MAARRLVSQTRSVPAASRAGYDAGWEAVRAAATARGAHAWRFRSTIHPERYLEFLEFAPGDDPRLDPAVAGPLLLLDRDIGPAQAEEWEELRG
jgi:hypothetical protein